MGRGRAAARVMLVQIVLQSVPAATHAHHHVAPQHPHEDEETGVSHAVLALRDFDHGKLVWTGAVAQDLPHQLIKVAQVAGCHAGPAGGSPCCGGRFGGVLLGCASVGGRGGSTELLLNLLFKLHKARGEQAKAGPTPCHLQQAQHNALLILPKHQVLCLKHEHFRHTQLCSAPADERGYIVAGHERAGHHTVCLEGHPAGWAGNSQSASRIGDSIGMLAQGGARGQPRQEAIATTGQTQAIQGVEPLGQVLLHGLHVGLTRAVRPHALGC